MGTQDEIKHNIKAHNRIARKYEKIHDEIFNDVEQARLNSIINQAAQAITSGSNPLLAMDIGCGSGNLTRHLINLGVITVSADVSENFLEIIEQTFSHTGLSRTLQINGADLSNINDNSFDLAAAYSVLHHVKDYLKLLREMCRILKRGGILYIDHEVNDTIYNPPVEYVDFLKSAISKKVILQKYLRMLGSPEFYVNFVRKRINPRYMGEGDIHVWPDDHIEWDKIEKLLIAENFDIILKKDYLLYRGSYLKTAYEKYKNKCTDTRMLFARKK